MVFDANKDEWEWPSDDAFSSVKVKATEVDEQEEEAEDDTEEAEDDTEEAEDIKEETAGVTEDALNTPMHSLGTTIKVSSAAAQCNWLFTLVVMCNCFTMYNTIDGVVAGDVRCRRRSGVFFCGP